VRADDVEVREPRCRVCRDETVRRRVNDLLAWRGVPTRLGPNPTRVVTYADILRTLEPVNAGRDGQSRITYSCLRVHAKRHYELAGVVAYWARRMDRDLRKALGGEPKPGPIGLV